MERKECWCHMLSNALYLPAPRLLSRRNARRCNGLPLGLKLLSLVQTLGTRFTRPKWRCVAFKWSRDAERVSIVN